MARKDTQQGKEILPQLSTITFTFAFISFFYRKVLQRFLREENIFIQCQVLNSNIKQPEIKGCLRRCNKFGSLKNYCSCVVGVLRYLKTWIVIWPEDGTNPNRFIRKYLETRKYLWELLVSAATNEEQESVLLVLHVTANGFRQEKISSAACCSLLWIVICLIRLRKHNAREHIFSFSDIVLRRLTENFLSGIRKTVWWESPNGYDGIPLLRTSVSELTVHHCLIGTDDVIDSASKRNWTS